MKLGTNLPEHLIGSDSGALSEFLNGLEDIGYSYVTIGDHVLGADLDVRPDWRPYFGQKSLYDRHMPWHEPLVLFGYMAALCKKLEFCTGILISPQRQSALLAKQAAEVDILTGGNRMRFVVSVGWNDVEFEAMGVDFKKRGRIMEEQVVVMRELWTKDLVTYHGEFHTLNAVSINPLPHGPVPLWMGGQSKVVLNRIGRLADGWFPYYPWFSPDLLQADLEQIHDAAKKAGRKTSDVGIEGAVYFADPRFPMPAGGREPPKAVDECVEYAQWWKRFGASRFWVTAPWANLGPEETGVRLVGKKWTGVETRLRALEDFKKAAGTSLD